MTSNDYTYHYDKTCWESFDSGNSREWVITNGLGGYGGGSLIGGRNRTHQGYLIAALHPPVERFVILEQITEWIKIGENTYDLETSRHRINGETVYSEGQKYLDCVEYDGTVTFEYSVPGVTLKKNIGLLRNENTAAAAYEITNDSDEEATVVFTPFFNYREHSELNAGEDLNFDLLITGDTLSLVPDKNPRIRIDFSISEGDYYELMDKYNTDQELITEMELETEGLCSSFTPYEISVTVNPHETKKFSAVCSVVCEKETGHNGDEAPVNAERLLNMAADRFIGPGSAEKLLKKVKKYYEDTVEAAGFGDVFASRLVLDADHFLARRQSTGLTTVLAGLPWFTDWGRDTMISFTGLTLCTGRFDDAAQILKSFAAYLHNGMIPNMFPDNGEAPLYNTVDASLWYFYAVDKYLEYTAENGDPEPERFIRTEIFPVLVNILENYEKGTDYSIFMEENALLHAGSNLDQVTWMDVRVGDLVVTPRHGCPVEINALWYNALKIGEKLAAHYAVTKADCEEAMDYKVLAVHYGETAGRVKEVFEKLFWNEEENCLYDVVYRSQGENGAEEGSWQGDPSVRPNQIYAVSLPYSLLSPEKERAVTDTVEKRLYALTGLKSLSSDHPDYHGRYRGALEKRDPAYHQGTSWGFLLGGFITAYAKVHEGEPDLDVKLRKLFEPVMAHQSGECCVGGICEIFEGDFPHAGCGCYTQAWSTGEILRAYTETVAGRQAADGRKK